jgi:hypothetical protein
MADSLADLGQRAFCGSVLPHERIVAEPKQHDDHLLGQGDDPEVQWSGRSRKRNFCLADIEQHGDATDGAAE